MREKNFLMPQTKFEMEGGPTKLGRFGEGGGGLAMQSTGPNSTNIGTLFFFFFYLFVFFFNFLKNLGSRDFCVLCCCVFVFFNQLGPTHPTFFPFFFFFWLGLAWLAIV